MPKDCESLPPKDCESYLNKNKEQLDRAASSGSGSNKERKSEPTCPPLTGGSGPQKNPDWVYDFSHLPERERNYMVMMRAIAAEGDEAIAEQARKKREAERNS